MQRFMPAVHPIYKVTITGSVRLGVPVIIHVAMVLCSYVTINMHMEKTV